MVDNFKRVKVTAHDCYICIDWETEETKGSYEFQKSGAGWKAYSSTEDKDLGLLQELLQACLLRIDTQED